MIKTKHLWLQFNHSPFFIWGKGRRSCSNGQQAKSSQDKLLKHQIRREMHPDIKIQICHVRLSVMSIHHTIMSICHIRPSCLSNPSRPSVMSVCHVRHVRHALGHMHLSRPLDMSVRPSHLSCPSITSVMSIKSVTSVTFRIASLLLTCIMLSSEVYKVASPSP